jgi:hypothetical protein
MSSSVARTSIPADNEIMMEMIVHTSILMKIL